MKKIMIKLLNKNHIDMSYVSKIEGSTTGDTYYHFPKGTVLKNSMFRLGKDVVFVNGCFEPCVVVENFTNHEQDVYDYVVKGLMHNPIVKMEQIRCMLIINKDKKYVIYKKNNKEYRVDCHKDDEFNWQVGFGLALSKCFGKQYKWQRARENFRHNIINEDDGSVKRVLDYESYSKWCIYEYYHNDTDDMAKLVQKVKEINELGKVDL